MYEEILDNFNKECQAELNKIKEELQKQLAIFWENNPEANLIRWTQYAPHFNDGDICTFSLSDITISNAINKEDYPDIDDGEYCGSNPDIWATSTFNKGFIKQILQTMDKLNLLQALFGPDSLVIITRQGDIIIKDYSLEHD
jgi:hypothetical protein